MRKNGSEMPCLVCGKVMYVQPNQWARGEGRYCSVACKSKAQSVQVVPFGSKYVRKDGYVYVRVGRHKYKLEHRIILEEQLGRALLPNEQGHHIDGNRQNNDPTNLRVVTAHYHPSLHPHLPVRVPVTCQECAREFETFPSRAGTRKYCSLECRYKSWGRQMKAQRQGKE